MITIFHYCQYHNTQDVHCCHWGRYSYSFIVKLREREGEGVDLGRSLTTQRSFIDGGWWMVDILSLELYTKGGCHPPTHHPPGSLITLH